MVVAGVQLGPGPGPAAAAATVGAAVGFPGGPGGPGAAPAAAVAVDAAAAAAAADVMYEEKAVVGPLRVRIVVVAVVAGPPDDAGRALPTVGGLVGVDASAPRCGGATGEPDADGESEDDVSEISVPFSVECDGAAMDEYWG